MKTQSFATPHGTVDLCAREQRWNKQAKIPDRISAAIKAQTNFERSVNWSEYRVTVKTDHSYFGDLLPAAASEQARWIAYALQNRFPGINIRECALIGHNPQDETTGPDQQAVRIVDEFYQTIA
jgi:hypothetical protein